MIKFWKDKANKVIEPELFSSVAEKLAKEIGENAKKVRRLDKRSQIRKFYDEVLNFASRLQSKPDDFEKMLPYIKMLNAKIAYAEGRELISKNFKNFISEALNQIKDKDDFDVFVSFFEAFMGYYRLYGPSE